MSSWFRQRKPAHGEEPGSPREPAALTLQEQLRSNGDLSAEGYAKISQKDTNEDDEEFRSKEGKAQLSLNRDWIDDLIVFITYTI